MSNVINKELFYDFVNLIREDEFTHIMERLEPNGYDEFLSNLLNLIFRHCFSNDILEIEILNDWIWEYTLGYYENDTIITTEDFLKEIENYKGENDDG